VTDLERKIPVEPLDPERVARIEREVLAEFRGLALEPRPARGWRLRPLLAAGALAALVVGGWLALRSRGPGGGDTALVAPPVQRVTTTAGPSRVDLGEAVITVDRDTEIEIHRDGGGIQVRLAHGAVDCEVAPRKDRPPFVVDAGEVDVTVVGTAFRVERDGQVRVSVSHGVVRVDAPDGSRAVAAGERWASAAEVALAPAGPAPRIAPPPPVPVADPALRDRHAAAPPLPARVEVPHPGRPPAQPPVKKAAAPVERGARPGPRAPRASLAPILEIAGTRDPRALVNQYMAMVSQQNYASARHAMYSMAWVQLFKLHDPDSAIRSALWFERRFPSGDFTEDALIIRIIATCDGGGSESCRAAAYTYLRRFAEGKYADAAHEITEWDVTR
jgi:FecR-like protein